jgi:hypothetical protein
MQVLVVHPASFMLCSLDWLHPRLQRSGHLSKQQEVTPRVPCRLMVGLGAKVNSAGLPEAAVKTWEKEKKRLAKEVEREEKKMTAAKKLKDEATKKNTEGGKRLYYHSPSVGQRLSHVLLQPPLVCIAGALHPLPLKTRGSMQISAQCHNQNPDRCLRCQQPGVGYRAASWSSANPSEPMLTRPWLLQWKS